MRTWRRGARQPSTRGSPKLQDSTSRKRLSPWRQPRSLRLGRWSTHPWPLLKAGRPNPANSNVMLKGAVSTHFAAKPRHQTKMRNMRKQNEWGYLLRRRASISATGPSEEEEVEEKEYQVTVQRRRLEWPPRRRTIRVRSGCCNPLSEILPPRGAATVCSLRRASVSATGP